MEIVRCLPLTPAQQTHTMCLHTKTGDVANATNTNMTPKIRIKDDYKIIDKVEASTNLLHTINRNTLHISEPYTHTLVEIETEGVKLKHYNYNNVINYDNNTTTMVFWNESEESLLLKVEVGVAGIVNVDCMFDKVVIDITFLPTHILKTVEYEILE